MAQRVSIAIPLYKSAPFIDTIVANVGSITYSEAEILISDRHCFDDTIDRLADHFAHDSRVRCIKSNDEVDWVGHLNILLEEAKGDYWRFLPHDDISPPGTLEMLIKALDTNNNAILAYGPTKAIDCDGNHSPRMDQPTPHPSTAEHDWTFGLALEMFWKGYFGGAFKGLVRRQLVLQKKLFIRSTLQQFSPERCWLFALCLIGRFVFVPEALYVKRYYKGSVHSRWSVTADSFRNVADVMCEYLCKETRNHFVIEYGSRDMQLNAERMAAWMDEKQGSRPQYIPAVDMSGLQIRQQSLPFTE